MSERNPIRISVIVPVGGRHEAIRELYEEYRAGLDSLRTTYEFVFVLDGPHADVMRDLEPLPAYYRVIQATADDAQLRNPSQSRTS